MRYESVPGLEGIKILLKLRLDEYYQNFIDLLSSNGD